MTLGSDTAEDLQWVRWSGMLGLEAVPGERILAV